MANIPKKITLILSDSNHEFINKLSLEKYATFVNDCITYFRLCYQSNQLAGYTLDALQNIIASNASASNKDLLLLEDKNAIDTIRNIEELSHVFTTVADMLAKVDEDN